MCRVIWQHPHSPSSKTLAGVGVGRGSARRPARGSAGRGQVLVNMLADKGGNKGWALAAKLEGTSAGRGKSVPSPPVGRPEQRGRQVDTCTEASLPPPITMHLDCQGPAVTYSKAASRLPQRTVVSSSKLAQCNVWLKMAAHEKEKEAARATLEWIWRQEHERKRLLRRNRKEHELCIIQRCDARCISWRRKELGGKKNTTVSEGPPEPVLTLLLNPLGWCKYKWSRKGTYESPEWAGDLWSTSPMDHQQLAMRMVCSWGLVKAYQWTRQSTYIFPQQHPM